MTTITVSAIKADVGGYVGHSDTHPRVREAVESSLTDHADILEGFHVTSAGDDLQLVLTHRQGIDDERIHELAWGAFERGTAVAEDLGLYGAGQDLLSEAFSGNVRGLGPGAAELEFTERPSDPIVVFAMDKTEPGAFNLPMYKVFGDPFNTPGLVIDPSMNEGFSFEIWDIEENRKVFLETPEDAHELLALIGAPSRYVIKRVYPREGNKNDPAEPVASVSTEKLVDVAGEYVGKDDPVAVVRSQSGLPAIGEVLEPFTFPHMVSGWMRGSHVGPMMPVPMEYSQTSRFDGPPRCIAAGFQVTNGNLVGPNDLFDDVAFDRARKQANEQADYLREHGPFEPHRLPLEELEYTTLPEIMDALSEDWQRMDSSEGVPEETTAKPVE
ncbi:fructose 1,6-bisphosphatase [Halorhabdus sp. CBA1104]|uniref:fructose-1,6-bisphosphate aldolase/phosphatase n=1 Tax=Halorhabdus sp. CBA1104 TaxID=1380432 RepID=UPI0012B41C36|nr:fructose-1,6-bisphosphate aldolase/phosphatase [Halorhabdus sp. CBA1104]QGN07985.1 fructose 1,6-bisphosphatase [Halorhabdus sp. CBA1104]